MSENFTSVLPLDRILSGEDEYADAADALLSPEVSDAPKAAFLKAMRQRGETVEELAGFAEAFLDFSVDPELEIPEETPVLDVCGTGGDGLHLFNVSTAVMFVLAAGGVKVVKHGNRAVSSQSGGADVLEALGIKIDVEPAVLGRCVAETGCGFIFAPKYHPAFKVIAPVRKQLAAEGVKTIFNLLGPLLNPAFPTHQLVGVFDENLLEKYARVLLELGREVAWVVHGKTADGQGMDELSTIGPNLVAGIDYGETAQFDITWGDPRKRNISELKGGDAMSNAELMMKIFHNGADHAALREIVAFNAAAGFFITDAVETLEDGVEKSFEILASGEAWEKVLQLKEISQG